MYANKDEAIQALKDGEYPSSYKFKNFLEDDKFILEAINVNKNILHHVGDELQNKLESILYENSSIIELVEYEKYGSRIPDKEGWSFYHSILDGKKSVNTEMLTIVINKTTKDISKDEFVNLLDEYGSLLYKGMKESEDWFGRAIDVKTYVPLLSVCEKKLAVTAEEYKDIICLSIENNPTVYNYFTDESKQNKEIVLKTVKQRGSMLEDMNNKFKDDNEVVLEAVRQNEYSLKYASERIKTLCSDSDPVETLTKIVETEKLYELLQKVVPPKGLALVRELSNECKQATMEQSNQVARVKPRMKL